MTLRRIIESHALRVQSISKTITHTDLTDTDQQQAFDFDAAVPAGAVVLTAYADVTIAFTDGAAGTATADLGVKTADTDAMLDAADLSTAVAKVNGPKGVADSGHYGGVTLQITVDGSVNLDTFTAGAVTFYVFYIDSTNYVL
jgi:hypothetical protein